MLPLRLPPSLPIALLLLALGSGALADMPLDYPDTPTVEQYDVYHGTTVADPYRWLEDVDSEETHAWVKAQNELTFGWLEQIPARETIRERLTQLWDYPRIGIPWKKAGRTFFRKNDGLQNQAVLYVQDGPEAEPRVLLDPNALSEHGTVALAATVVSPNGKYLAYSLNTGGSDWREWKVRDVDTGEDLPDHIEWSKFSGASWSHDDEGFYYSRYDAPSEGEALEQANYFQKLYYHRVGTDQGEDRLVYERPDHKEWGFDGTVTDDGRYLVIHVWEGSAEKNRLFYQRLDGGNGEVVEFLPEGDANFVFVGSVDDTFYIRTDLDAPRYRLVAVDAKAPARENWVTVIEEDEDVLQDAALLNRQIVAMYMHHAHDQVRLHDLQGRFQKEIALPTLGAVKGFYGELEDTETYYSFGSFLYPGTIFRYDFTTGESTVFYDPGVDFDPSGYTTQQVFYESKDGTSVPMFLVHRKDLALDGSNPVYLYGYGGFNVSMTPYFSVSLLPWLEMGGVYALANLRGGGEYGEEWHRAGMVHEKQNVFDDFIAAGEWLIEKGYTRTDRLSIGGGSNGGTLVGACLNQRPDLFGAGVAQVGVMDMLRFHKFTIGWAWVSDYGSSDDPEQFETLLDYSPYHRIEAGVRYPATLITTADRDDRVVPGHSFKYAARLQKAQGGDAPILIRIQTNAGHSAGRPTAMIIEEHADHWAFLVRALGVELPGAGR